MGDDWRYAWQTGDELRFIRDLPPTALPGYIKGAKLRNDWGHVDHQQAIRLARDLLNLERKGAKA